MFENDLQKHKIFAGTSILNTEKTASEILKLVLICQRNFEKKFCLEKNSY